jgi:hypothetical protein
MAVVVAQPADGPGSRGGEADKLRISTAIRTSGVS